MSNAFRTRIRLSLSDSNLQAALDANAERRKVGRLAAFASLPDAQESRQRAHAIKADVIARLDDYLAQFVERVQANGILVHRAADAAEALNIVLDIVRQAASESAFPILVAKSKSMLSEEINLNHALEAAGIRVVETDLGEYIVQLRGERPSHIITPAVHLRRGDVGRLFEEKLGLPYTEDISMLTTTARKTLREIFLGADVGLSGVNFGVSETGTLCLVTNEGNGRMVTTLPPVHIALMGMERLVPTLDDLALFLSLLPRSATGQKLSVYTSLIHAPLAGQTRHLVILDNGRTALRQSPLAESLYCIRCGACLNACPVFRELGGHAYGSIYPGPIGSVISTGLVDPSFAYLSQASSLCGACKEVCPVDIDLPGLLLRVRAGEGADRYAHPGVGLPAPVRTGLKAFRFVAGTPGLFAVFQRLTAVGAALLSPRSRWMRLPAFTGWGYSKDFPRPVMRPFRARFNRAARKVERSETQVAENQGREGKDTPVAPKVSQGDMVEQFINELQALGGSTVRVNERDLPRRLTDFLRRRGIDRVLVDDPDAGFIPKGAGISYTCEPDPTVCVGLTGALAGIADSGTLVLAGGKNHQLAASLLPEIHLAVLRKSDLFATLPGVFRISDIRDAPTAVLITGPSRTADIEMTLTIGVHGPGELHVFLVDDL